MDVFIEARTLLQYVRFERLIKDDDAICESISRMTDYIRALAQEYADHLSTVSRARIVFERDTQRYLHGETDSVPSMEKLDMEQYPQLEGFIEQFPDSQFQEGYDKAKSCIENKLSALHAQSI